MQGQVLTVILIDHYKLKIMAKNYLQNMNPSPCDNHGEKGLDTCKASHMRILNCRFNDKTGKLTRFPTKSDDSPSLIDYFITDESTLLTVH